MAASCSFAVNKLTGQIYWYTVYLCLLIISVKKVLFLCLKQLVCSCLKLLMIIQTVAKRASWNKTVRFWVFGFWYLGNVTLEIGTQRIQIKVDELNRARHRHIKISTESLPGRGNRRADFLNFACTFQINRLLGYQYIVVLLWRVG